MAEVRSLICDICDTPDATGYTVGERGKAQWEIDLCSACAQPLAQWQAVGRMPHTSRRPYRKYKVKATDASRRGEKTP